LCITGVASGADTGVVSALDRDLIISQLRQMASLSKLDYKKAFRRLMLTCHPDKNAAHDQAAAGALFQMVMRHADCYMRREETGVSFADADWLEGVDAADVSPGIQCRGGNWVPLKLQTTPGTKIRGSVKYCILL
jgi:hypothetical protein